MWCYKSLVTNSVRAKFKIGWSLVTLYLFIGHFYFVSKLTMNILDISVSGEAKLASDLRQVFIQRFLNLFCLSFGCVILFIKASHRFGYPVPLSDLLPLNKRFKFSNCGVNIWKVTCNTSLLLFRVVGHHLLQVMTLELISHMREDGQGLLGFF
jgi:hypothetical protein